jgi:hypothetical protein
MFKLPPLVVGRPGGVTLAGLDGVAGRKGRMVGVLSVAGAWESVQADKAIKLARIILSQCTQRLRRIMGLLCRLSRIFA